MLAPTRLRRPGAKSVPTDVLEKDETELRLEKALFGDDAGFFESLKPKESQEDWSLARVEEREDETSDVEKGLDDVADEELFFFDAGAGELPVTTLKALDDDDQLHTSSRTERTWYDSDDDRITISLATSTRLRKLRDTEDDDVVTGREYIERLRRQYVRLHPLPEWVTYARKKRKMSHKAEDDDEQSDSDVSMGDGESLLMAQPLDELLRTAGSLTRTDSKKSSGIRKLRPDTLDIQRCKDVAGPGPSSIDTLQFHPHYPLLLAAGPSSTVTIYHVSAQPPNPNPILTSLHLNDTPLHTAAFCRPPYGENDSQDQTQIFLSSRRRYFHTWSLSTGVVTKVTRALYGQQARKDQRTMEAFKISPCGRYMGLIGSSKKGGGSVNVLATDSMQWLCSCRIESGGGVADFAWWRDGNGFVVAGKNGEISEYNVETRRVVSRWIDQGAVGTSVIALGGDIGSGGRGGSRWVAVGSSSGIVNVYDRRGWTEDGQKNEERREPVKVLDQLTTPISCLEFSADGQMLVMASRWKKNALRLVHLPSCRVYRNWPTEKTPLGRISAVALSPDGSYLSVSNEQGRIRLWEIRE